MRRRIAGRDSIRSVGHLAWRSGLLILPLFEEDRRTPRLGWKDERRCTFERRNLPGPKWDFTTPTRRSGRHSRPACAGNQCTSAAVQCPQTMRNQLLKLVSFASKTYAPIKSSHFGRTPDTPSPSSRYDALHDVF
jgi:hypothetical protein